MASDTNLVLFNRPELDTDFGGIGPGVRAV